MRVSTVEIGQIKVASMREIVRRNVRFLNINNWDIVLHWNEATRNERSCYNKNRLCSKIQQKSMNLEIIRELYKKVEEKRWEPKQSVLVVRSALEFEYSFVFVKL
jgi:hypothetical protein